MLRECSGEQLKALREQIEELSHRISGPMFVKPIPSAIPDLRDLGAPQGDSFCIPPHESSTAQVREVDEAVARDRCACELGLPESEVDRWKADEPTEEPPPPVGAKWKASATRRFRRMRDFLSVFRRHSVPRESQ
jgi:hypothetical protein